LGFRVVMKDTPLTKSSVLGMRIHMFSHGLSVYSPW
jgi:hypothetical protein